MISLEEYNAIMETEYIMSNQAVLNDIQRSLSEIADGKGVEVDINSL